MLSTTVSADWAANEIAARDRKIEQLRGYIAEAEVAIMAQFGHAGWGNSTPEHLASRVAAVCNHYRASLATISELCSDRQFIIDQLRALKEAETVLVEAAIPLEVIVGQNRVKPHVELSPELLAAMDAAVGRIRAFIVKRQEPT